MMMNVGILCCLPNDGILLLLSVGIFFGFTTDFKEVAIDMGPGPY
jgi:hypothetical protein